MTAISNCLDLDCCRGGIVLKDLLREGARVFHVPSVGELGTKEFISQVLKMLKAGGTITERLDFQAATAFAVRLAKFSQNICLKGCGESCKTSDFCSDLLTQLGEHLALPGCEPGIDLRHLQFTGKDSLAREKLKSLCGNCKKRCEVGESLV